jgi:hypothetical protein
MLPGLRPPGLRHPVPTQKPYNQRLISDLLAHTLALVAVAKVIKARLGLPPPRSTATWNPCVSLRLKTLQSPAPGKVAS